jgi:hypothetical protein
MTYIHYSYSDANNYKQHASIRLTAPLTDEQQRRIVRTLSDGCWFIPEQVGVEPLQSRFGGLDPQADHPYHELADEHSGIEQDDSAWGDVTGQFSPEELVAAFEQVGADGWDEVKYSIANRFQN